MKNENLKTPSAFPLMKQNPHTGLDLVESGMTLRDYFAAKTMQGIFANNEMWVAMCMDRGNCTREKSDSVEDYVAQQCYKMADAMLKEREVKTM